MFRKLKIIARMMASLCIAISMGAAGNMLIVRDSAAIGFSQETKQPPPGAEPQDEMKARVFYIRDGSSRMKHLGLPGGGLDFLPAAFLSVPGGLTHGMGPCFGIVSLLLAFKASDSFNSRAPPAA